MHTRITGWIIKVLQLKMKTINELFIIIITLHNLFAFCILIMYVMLTHNFNVLHQEPPSINNAFIPYARYWMNEKTFNASLCCICVYFNICRWNRRYYLAFGVNAFKSHTKWRIPHISNIAIRLLCEATCRFHFKIVAEKMFSQGMPSTHLYMCKCIRKPQ